MVTTTLAKERKRGLWVEVQEPLMWRTADQQLDEASITTPGGLAELVHIHWPVTMLPLLAIYQCQPFWPGVHLRCLG